MKVIYTVHALRFAPEKRNITWGWYATAAEAEEAIRGNYTDMFERGWYDYALISEVPEGLLATPEEIKWFKATFVEEGVDAGNIVSIDEVTKPVEAEGYFFGL